MIGFLNFLVWQRCLNLNKLSLNKEITSPKTECVQKRELHEISQPGKTYHRSTFKDRIRMGVSTRSAKFENLSGQSRAQINTIASTNR